MILRKAACGYTILERPLTFGKTRPWEKSSPSTQTEKPVLEVEMSRHNSFNARPPI